MELNDLIGSQQPAEDATLLKEWHEFEHRKTARLWSDPQTFEEFKRTKGAAERILHEAYRDILGPDCKVEP